jgi:hypothetical protein
MDHVFVRIIVRNCWNVNIRIFMDCAWTFHPVLIPSIIVQLLVNHTQVQEHPSKVMKYDVHCNNLQNTRNRSLVAHDLQAVVNTAMAVLSTHHVNPTKVTKAVEESPTLKRI